MAAKSSRSSASCCEDRFSAARWKPPASRQALTQASSWRRAGSLSDPAKWRSWLYALARHAGIDAARRARRRKRLHDRLTAWLPGRKPAEADAGRRMILQEDHRRALNAVAHLPEIYRGPFVLRHLADWSYRDVAEAMDMSIQTVETRLVRARRLLREALGPGAEE